MSLTLEEIKERLLRLYDDLLEALQISSEEILDRFEDKLIKKIEAFHEELEEEEGEYAE
jgi:molecular chaperone GrpE (heat shock protein)